MRVALRGADRQAGRLRDLLERGVETIFERDHRRLRDRQLREAATELAARLRLGERSLRVAVTRDAQVLVQRLGSPLRRPARLRHVLARVHDEPVQPGGELRLAAELSDTLNELHERLLRRVAGVVGVAEHVKGDPVDPIGMACTQGFEGEGVSISGTTNEDRVREPLVDERPVRPQLSDNSTGSAHRGLHGRPTLESRVPEALVPHVVLPALRGTFGRHYRYAAETETTQRMLPADVPHGAVALAERQTAGRGRLGRTWVDSGLMFSVALRPPPPVARWPELTLVAARAVAAAIGPEATIKHPNDVLVDGRKVAGILAEANERVVVGIGINVGGAAWPDAGWVDRDRLELLVDVLARLERNYDEWLLVDRR